MGPRARPGAFQLTLLATTNLASRLTPKRERRRVGLDAMQLPETIIGTAFGIVAFPHWRTLARSDRDGLRGALADSLRMVLALAVPATIGLILLGRPLIQVLYQRGAFDSQATDAVYVALRFFALGLVGHCCLELAARTFFAQKDTVTPLFVAAGSAGLNIALGVLLMGRWRTPGWPCKPIAVTAEVESLALLSRRLTASKARTPRSSARAASIVMAVVARPVGSQRRIGAGRMAAFLAAAGPAHSDVVTAGRERLAIW
jgi:peptidoglycan biosynthesis protein MviN/MurJ (putative lipid II flippase)